MTPEPSQSRLKLVDRAQEHPWYPRYARKEQVAAGPLTYEQFGVLTYLRDYAWDSGCLPDNENLLREILGISRYKFHKVIWPAIEKYFHKNGDGTLVYAEDETQRRIAADSINKSRIYGLLGWQKRLENQRRKAQESTVPPLSTPYTPPMPETIPPPTQQQQEQLQGGIATATVFPRVDGDAAVADFPLTYSEIARRFPTVTTSFVNALASSCPPGTSDELLARAVRESHTERQTSAGLYRTTVPAWLKNFYAQSEMAAQRVQKADESQLRETEHLLRTTPRDELLAMNIWPAADLDRMYAQFRISTTTTIPTQPTGPPQPIQPTKHRQDRQDTTPKKDPVVAHSTAGMSSVGEILNHQRRKGEG